jgi:hypothetical protein
MSNLDPKGHPESLKKFQEEFGRAISSPFIWENGSYKTSIESYPKSIVDDSIDYDDNLKGIERIEYYNKQYWFRLLSTLQEEFPLLSYDMGYYDFNQLSTAYLNHHPSSSPNLNDLIQYFENFTKDILITENILNKTQLEILYFDIKWAQLFFLSKSKIEVKSDLNNLSPSEAISRQLIFQEGFELIKCSTNHFVLRNEVIEYHSQEAPEETKSLIDAQLKKDDYYLALFRLGNVVQYELLDFIQYQILTQLKTGFSLSEAIENVLNNLDEKEVELLAQNIQNWFSRWTSLTFFISAQEKK